MKKSRYSAYPVELGPSDGRLLAAIRAAHAARINALPDSPLFVFYTGAGAAGKPVELPPEYRPAPRLDESPSPKSPGAGR